MNGDVARRHTAGNPLAPAVERQHIEGARSALAAWLLHGGAQLASGEHVGAVAGWLDSAGRAAYVYPEITGYYLQWLAWHTMRRGAGPDVATRAEAAQRWLSMWAGRTDPPQTRVYLGASGDDWRNQALFFFDVAMVLRGLASAARAQLLVPDPALVARLCHLLAQLIDADGMFAACVSTRVASGGDRLPDRWSTRRGPFLAKAAGGVLFAAETLPHVDPALVRAATATFAASLQWAIDHPHHEAHPFLYCVEGLLNRPDHEGVSDVLAQSTPQVAALVASMDATGHLPEATNRTGARRLDIVAQAVRATLLLNPSADAVGAGDITPLARMTRLLVRNTTAVGAIPFAPDQQPLQFSIWTAMFAEQALALARHDANDRTMEWPALCLV